MQSYERKAMNKNSPVNQQLLCPAQFSLYHNEPAQVLHQSVILLLHSFSLFLAKTRDT